MSDILVEKRRFMWSITSYSRENVNKYDDGEYEESDPFEITIGNNHTKWAFNFHPNGENDYNDFFIRKLKTDNDDFSVFMKLLDNKYFRAREFLSDASEIKPALGWRALSRNKAIIEENKEMTLNNTLELAIVFELRQKESQSNTSDTTTSFELTSQLFNSNDFHDITLVCSDEKELPAHRCILAARSSVFKAMLATNMLEKTSNIITIDDIDSETMLEVLRFMYTNKAENLDKIASKIIYAAEKYDLQKLKSLCVASLISQITSENVFECAALADRYNLPNMMHKCLALIDRNYWTLKHSKQWRKMSSDMMQMYVKYIKEVTSLVVLPAAILQ